MSVVTFARECSPPAGPCIRTLYDSMDNLSPTSDDFHAVRGARQVVAELKLDDCTA